MFFVSNPSLWIAFALDSDPTMELGGGRTPITANGYAFKAVNADQANQAANAIQLGGVAASGYVRTTGGSMNNSYDGPILSVANTSTGGRAFAISANTNSAGATAIRGAADSSTGSGIGVHGSSSGLEGIGVIGTSNGIGVQGSSSSLNSAGGVFSNGGGGDLIRGLRSRDMVFRLFNDGGAYFGGNVGIGTTSPANKLHVNGGSFFAGNVGIGTPSPSTLLYLSQSTVSDAVRLSIDNTNTAAGSRAGRLQFLNNGTVKWQIGTDTPASGTNDFGIYDQGSSAWRLKIDSSGNVGIGTTNPQAKLDVNGTTKTNVLEIMGGADLSERFEVNAAQNLNGNLSQVSVEPGMVVAIDPDNPGKLAVSRTAYDRKVAGIISGAGGIKTGMLMSQTGSMADGNHPVALTGRVYCRADAFNGPIEPGDLLTTSSIPGHAMKVTDYAQAQGAILGKAMTGLKEGSGLVLVLVTLQ